MLAGLRAPDGRRRRRHASPLSIAGDGPPLLLLHGYPQTRACWHRVAPALAARLHGRRGRPARLRRQRRSRPAGRTTPPTPSARWPPTWSAVMAALGHPRFAVAGHDRGGRVVAPHGARPPGRGGARGRARHRAHAHALRRHRPGLRHRLLPLVLPDPARRPARGDDRPRPRVVPARDRSGAGRGAPSRWPRRRSREYARCFRDPAAIHASCEDYRAAAGIDLAHDAADADARIACPLLVLWGEHGAMHRLYDVLEHLAAAGAPTCAGAPLPCGHFLPEEAPERPAAALEEFFAACLARRAAGAGSGAGRRPGSAWSCGVPPLGPARRARSGVVAPSASAAGFALRARPRRTRPGGCTSR